MKVSGNDLFVTAMKKEGVDTIFAYPGGMVVNLLDALHDCHGIDLVLPRHEQGLIHAADGYARATGKVGVCLVTSGPGATNLVTGIATANYDSIPLVCFTGQVPEHLIGNDAFQEVDIIGVTRNIAKFVIMVRDREMLAQRIKEAFYIARSGKPGPVLVDLPTDVMAELGSTSYPTEVNIRGYKPNKGVHVGQLKKAINLLEEAKKPMFLIGGGVNLAHAQEEMTKLAEKIDAPVITTDMGRGAISTEHPLYIGNIGMHGNLASNKAIMECDVLFSIGTRFNDRITGTIDTFAKNAKIIHIDIDAASISRNIEVDIPIVADAKLAITKMLKYAKKLDISDWVAEIMEVKKQYPINMNSYKGVTPEKIIKTINEMYDDLIITTDVGQNQLWTTQYIALGGENQLLTSGGLGTMGYGLPAAIGAKIGNPDKNVICISGDGGIQMNIQEMATAVAQELPITICILNNGYLGNVRQWQELFFNKRYSSTCLRYRKSCNHDCQNPDKCCPKYTPDFVKLAESYEALGIRVTKEEEIKAAFEQAKANTKGPTVIEFYIDPTANVFPMVPGGKSLNDMIMDC